MTQGLTGLNAPHYAPSEEPEFDFAYRGQICGAYGIENSDLTVH
jgi:hypothetical protein